ncbi:MAG: exo-alpha-sialidase [Chloroflexi bacterium]|nr:exo-alpha-sialidase [Chloroflexota bacterium]
MKNKGAVLRIAAVAAVMAALLMPRPAVAEGGPQAGGPEVFSPFQPVRDMFGGFAWLMANGLGPTQLGKRSGLQEVQTQAPGAGAAGLIPYRSPAAKFSRNVLVTQDFSRIPFQTEPSLAVDPKDPQHLILGVIDYGFPSLTTYSSIDGGTTWQGPFQPPFPHEELGTAGDPVIAFGRDGAVYNSYITVNVKEYFLGPLVAEAVVSSISVSSSGDGGTTWREGVITSSSTLSSKLMGDPQRPEGTITFEFLDKPWMSTGPNPRDNTKDNLYVTYTKFADEWNVLWLEQIPLLANPTTFTTIEMVRSEDGGVSWSTPVAVSPKVRWRFGGLAQQLSPETQPQVQAEGTRRIVQGSQPVVDPRDGALYVAWLDTTDDDSFKGLAEIWVARSTDGGRRLEKVKAASFLEPAFRPRSAFFRSWGTTFPQVALGPEGEVYVAFVAMPPDRKTDDGDVFIVRSLDQGKTWGLPVRVNDDDTNRFQFFPSIDVDSQGVVHAMWGDMRDDPQGLRYNIYYSKSADKGRTWELNARVSDFPSNPNFGFTQGLFIGDYFSLKTGGDEVYMVWADTRLGEFGSVNQKIAFARQKLMPDPAIFLSPPAGPAGRDITIQGHNFQPDRNVFIEVGGVIVSVGRTSSDGRFTSQIFVPISGEGAHSVRVLEESGNVAAASFFMEFGFDNIQNALGKVDPLAQGLDAVGARLDALSEGQKDLPALRYQLSGIADTVEAIRSEQQVKPPSNTGFIYGLVGLGAATGLLLVVTVVLAVLSLRRSHQEAQP